MKHRELPLSALRAFTVAAEWKSLTRAAVELGVTHGAISRQIGQLEKWIGTNLFMRQGRSMTLTPAGELLSQQLRHSFGEMLTACSDISLSGEKQVITVEAPTTFAMYWLLPRITQLERELRNTDILLETRLSTQTYEGPPSDIVITRGSAHDRRLKHFEEKLLLTEEMCLIASPRYIAATPIESPDDVIRQVVVGSVTRPNDWPEWLRRANLQDSPLRYRHMFDHLFIALHCVMSGVGSIVAPANILTGSMHTSKFVPLLPHIKFAGESYFLRYRPGSSAKVQRLCALIEDSVVLT
jgi:LysR family glycine cleavage system transcriptional activator